MFAIASARPRSTSSISGLDAQINDMPKSCFDSTPTSGRSYRMSRASLTETAPALTRSLSKSGKISSSVWRPPASRPCGVDLGEYRTARRRMPSGGRAPRSRPAQSALPKHRPSTAAPTTTARRPKRPLMTLCSFKVGTGRSLLAGYGAISASGESRYIAEVFTPTPESLFAALDLTKTAARSLTRNLLSFCSLLARTGGATYAHAAAAPRFRELCHPLLHLQRAQRCMRKMEGDEPT
jgi:hypothetical protein